MYPQLCLVLLVVVTVYQARATQNFITRPTDTVVNEGNSVTLPCIVSGMTGYIIWVVNFDTEGRTPQVLIYQNGTAPQGAYRPSPTLRERVSITGNPNLGQYHLTIRHVVMEDEGEYQCGLYFPHVYSEFVKLTVLVPPEDGYPICSAVVENSAYREGNLMNITCLSVGGKPEAELSLYRNSSTLVAMRSVHLNSIWVEWNISRDDNGATFYCTSASPAQSSQKHCSIGPLNIIYGPTITIDPHTVTAEIGDNATFTCKVDSNPRIDNITWYVGGRQVVDNEDDYRTISHSDMGMFKLYIPYLDVENNTNISCVAESASGSNVAVARIVVLDYNLNVTVAELNNYNINMKTELIIVGSIVVVILIIILLFALRVLILGKHGSRKTARLYSIGSDFVYNNRGFELFKYRSTAERQRHNAAREPGDGETLSKEHVDPEDKRTAFLTVDVASENIYQNSPALRKNMNEQTDETKLDADVEAEFSYVPISDIKRRKQVNQEKVEKAAVIYDAVVIEHEDNEPDAELHCSTSFSFTGAKEKEADIKKPTKIQPEPSSPKYFVLEHDSPDLNIASRKDAEDVVEAERNDAGPERDTSDSEWDDDSFDDDWNVEPAEEKNIPEISISDPRDNTNTGETMKRDKTRETSIYENVVIGATKNPNEGHTESAATDDSEDSFDTKVQYTESNRNTQPLSSNSLPDERIYDAVATEEILGGSPGNEDTTDQNTAIMTRNGESEGNSYQNTSYQDDY
ncbi:uncharacterized protein LOC144355668 [Saccoglossus kowalevskii]